jgi:hypothetical protein
MTFGLLRDGRGAQPARSRNSSDHSRRAYPRRDRTLLARNDVRLTTPVVASILALGGLGTGVADILNYRLIHDESAPPNRRSVPTSSRRCRASRDRPRGARKDGTIEHVSSRLIGIAKSDVTDIAIADRKEPKQAAEQARQLAKELCELQLEHLMTNRGSHPELQYGSSRKTTAMTATRHPHQVDDRSPSPTA